jgi:hypothetical protein
MSNEERRIGFVIGDEETIETEINGKYTQINIRGNTNAEFYRKAAEMGRRRNPAPPIEIVQTMEAFLPLVKKNDTDI